LADLKEEIEAMRPGTEERKTMEKAQEGSDKNGVIRSHVRAFIPFIDDSSHICYAAPMTNFNFWPNPSSSPFFTPFVTRDKIKAQTQLDADRFRLEKNKETAMPCSSRLKALNVDKEAREAAKKPAKQSVIFLSTHKPAPPCVPLANPSPSASLSKLHSSSTKSPIRLFVGPPGIRIVRVSSMMSKRR